MSRDELTKGSRRVRAAGRWLAAGAAAGLLCSLFFDWFAEPLRCVRAPCPAPGVSGWEALGFEELALVAVALAGMAWALAAESRPAVLLRFAGPVAALALSGALVVAWRVAWPPGGLEVSADRLEGGVLALIASLVLALGALMVALAGRTTEETPARIPATVFALGALVLGASLSLPWVNLPDPLTTPTGRLQGTLTAWQAFLGPDLFLTTLAVTMLLATVAAAVLGWRVLHLGLGLGGWVAAALTLLSVAVDFERRAPGASARVGFYVALAVGATVMLVGVWAATRPTESSDE